MPGGCAWKDGSRPQGRLYIFVTAVLLCPMPAEVISRSPIAPVGAGSKCNTTKGESPRGGGWKLTCREPSYKLEYAPRSFVKLECSPGGQEPPFTPAMFANYNLTDVYYFQFDTCPPPTNLTFGEVLEGVTVKKLRFEGDAPGTDLDSSTFVGLPSLESLIIKVNQLKSLPPDLLSNLTSLKSVELKNNSLKSVPESLFEGLDNLTSIELSGNELQELPSGIFANMTRLERLHLSGNKLSSLPAGIFLGLKGLGWLDLDNNRIQELHHELFLDTPKLKHLSIRGNNLTRLQSDLLQGTKFLEELDLSDNRLTKLPENFLEGLGVLKSISLNNCNLKGIGEGFFSYSPRLRFISMHNNKLTSLSQELLKNNRDLQKLLIQHNDITELPSKVFDQNINLVTLKINHNNLTSLPVDVFDHLSSLQHLDLSGNAFKTLDAQLLFENQQLQELYVSKNQLTELHGTLPFGRSSGLKIVDFSYNHITSLPNRINWELYTELQKLVMNNNNITTLSVSDIRLTAAGVTVELMNNHIRTVSMKHVREIEAAQATSPTGTTKIELRGNPLECDCMLLDFVIYSRHKNPKRTVEFTDIEDLECQEPVGLTGEKLTDVRPEDFVCQVTKDCPWNCQCIEIAVSQTTVVTCSHLTDLPDRLPSETSEVHLEHNGVTNLDDLGSPVWENVTKIYLDHNNITISDWIIPRTLQVLSLKGNQLEYMSQSLTDFVENGDTTQLFLGGNPWLCDCQTLQFKDWLLENREKVPDLDDMYCGHPVLFRNGSEIRTAIVQLTSDICPEKSTTDSGQIVIVSVVCAILACLLLIVSVLYYRNKQIVIAYFYIHFYNAFVCFFSDDDLDEDKTFDAFVSYSSADRDVAMDLVGQLEGGDPSFRLCIHERDWLPGNLISWNIVNSVQNSRKTILVLSRHFLDSVWFQVEFHTAYYQMLEDRIDRLIVVVRGDLPEKSSLDKDLRYLLSTKTFLQWGERWFWEKLRYALPHRRGTGKASVVQKSVQQDKSFPLKQRPSPELLKIGEEKTFSLTTDTVQPIRTDAQPASVQVIVSPENKTPTGTNQVNSTKALSRRFNGARSNTPGDGQKNTTNSEAPFVLPA